MNGFIMYNGRSSKDFGIVIEESGAWAVPGRDFESLAVEGRNGELTIDNGRYENLSISYKCTIGRGFPVKMSDLNAWLMSNTGYNRLEDSQQPEYFRMARVAEGLSPEVFANLIGGKFEITFDCKPQRWLKSGEDEITLQTTNAIYNPTLYNAYPVFEITGNGNLVIGSKTITIANNPGTLILDCELGDAYSKSAHTNYNQYVTESDLELTSLAPGVNNITKPAGMTVKMKPRWWTL